MTKMMTIGSVGRSVGLCVETLRALERRGIVTPKRDSTGRRIFDDEDIKKIRAYLARRHSKTPMG